MQRGPRFRERRSAALCCQSGSLGTLRLGLLFYMTGDLMGFSLHSSDKSHVQVGP